MGRVEINGIMIRVPDEEEREEGKCRDCKLYDGKAMCNKYTMFSRPNQTCKSFAKKEK